MTLTYETVEDRVVLITLNRPEKLNAFNAQMRLDMMDATRKASGDPKVAAVVVTGAGRAFCAGADISGGAEKYNVEDILNTEYGAFLNVIMTMPKPVIAAVNGPAAGIGMTTALACDLQVMAEEAYLMSAFANIGLVPDGGLSYFLTQQIGYSRAYQVAIEAEKIGAARALEWGLVNRVVSNADIVSEAVAWAHALTKRAPIALELTKRAFRAAGQDRWHNAVKFEAMTQRTAMQTEDFAEGVKAIFEKRVPEFKGR